MNIIAYHGTSSIFPFKEFNLSTVGSGLVSKTKFKGFFFTTEEANAKFYTEWFVAKVRIANVFKNPLQETHPPFVLEQAAKDHKSYFIENILDGHYYSDVVVVPFSKVSDIDILNWDFVGDKHYLFDAYNDWFSFEEDSQVDLDSLEETLDIMGLDLDYLLTIPIFKEYYDSVLD